MCIGSSDYSRAYSFATGRSHGREKLKTWGLEGLVIEYDLGRGRRWWDLDRQRN